MHSSSNVPCQLGSGSWTFKFSLNSKHVSPMKEVREEVPNLQENNCEACGEKFETEDNLDTLAKLAVPPGISFMRAWDSV